MIDVHLNGVHCTQIFRIPDEKTVPFGKLNALINRHLAFEHNFIFYNTKKTTKKHRKAWKPDGTPLEKRADDEHSFDTTRRNYYANFWKTWKAANSKFSAEYFTWTNGRKGSLIIQGSWCPCDLLRNPDSTANNTPQ